MLCDQKSKGFKMTKLREHVITTNENVVDTYEYIFAPWVKAMGLTELRVSEGTASALLPQNLALQWANGAICEPEHALSPASVWRRFANRSKCPEIWVCHRVC